MKKVHPKLGLCCNFCGEPKPQLKVSIYQGRKKKDELWLHRNCWEEIRATVKQYHRAIL